MGPPGMGGGEKAKDFKGTITKLVRLFKKISAGSDRGHGHCGVQYSIQCCLPEGTR